MSKKILVVEDNETNMYLIRYILSKNGYEVIEAVTGEEGVEAAKTPGLSLVIMDIQLPDISGLEATSRIRAQGLDKNFNIVALTAHAMMGDREKAIEAGCNGYIEKPIDPEKFISQIEEFM